MSNFLHRLLQRSLSPAMATVQPRLASRYESDPAPARLSAERRETNALTPLPSQPAVSTAPLTLSPQREIPSPSVPVPVTTLLNYLAPTTSITAPVQLSAAPTASAVTPPPPTTSPAPTPIFPTPVATEPRETFSLPPHPSNTLLVAPSTERIRENHPTLAAGFSLRSTTPTSLSPAPPFPPTVPLPAAPAPPPTIQVTIGRIDIRAIHAPTAAAPVAPAPAPARRPLVSLEHYLNQRDPK